MPPPLVRPPRPARTTCLHACAGRSGKRRAWEAGVRDADRVNQLVDLAVRDASGQLRPVVCEIRMTRASVILRMRAAAKSWEFPRIRARNQPTKGRRATQLMTDLLLASATAKTVPWRCPRPSPPGPTFKAPNGPSNGSRRGSATSSRGWRRAAQGRRPACQ